MATKGRVARTSLIPTGKAHLAVKYIREKGVARSDEIERELGVTNASALLKRHVDRGELVSCQVTRPGRKGVINEYRISAAAGMPRKGEDWRGDSALRKPPTPPREEAQEQPCVHHAPPRAGAIASTGRANDARFVGEIQEDVAPPTPPRRVLSAELKGRLLDLANKPPLRASFSTNFSATYCSRLAREIGIRLTCCSEDEGIRVWRRA